MHILSHPGLRATFTTPKPFRASSPPKIGGEFFSIPLVGQEGENIEATPMASPPTKRAAMNGLRLLGIAAPTADRTKSPAAKNKNPLPAISVTE